jgi:hypothetical protein
MDEMMEATAEPGHGLAVRLIQPDEFCMTTGTPIPMDRRLLLDVFLALPPTERTDASLDAMTDTVVGTICKSKDGHPHRHIGGSRQRISAPSASCRTVPCGDEPPRELERLPIAPPSLAHPAVNAVPESTLRALLAQGVVDAFRVRAPRMRGRRDSTVPTVFLRCRGGPYPLRYGPRCGPSRCDFSRPSTSLILCSNTCCNSHSTCPRKSSHTGLDRSSL